MVRVTVAADELDQVRRHLVTERGLEKPRVYFCGYWRRMHA
jgi:NADPH-dependent ferric siderophore reductase